MRATKTDNRARRLWIATAVAAASVLTAAAHAAAPGITGPSFSLDAKAAYITQPDGGSIYSWGYGCSTAPAGYAPAAVTGASCPDMQLPGPTLIVTEGATVAVTLTNNLPATAGNTSMLFPGFDVTASGADAVDGLLTKEAPNGKTVTYTFRANSVGTHAYYSGTQADLQVEMGLYGAIIVLPATIPTNCSATSQNDLARTHDFGRDDHSVEQDFRLAKAAYNHSATCYDREYLFQLSEIDPKIHSAAEAIANCLPATNGGAACPTNMNSVETELYHPAYYLVNGRSMPDDMDPNYAAQYPHQPYNGNPHMHPGEMTLLRVVGQGRWQHPLHEHGNHVRILARDGNLLLAPKILSGETEARLAGPLLFTTTTTPGQAMDGIFYWTGKGLNWDVFGHGYVGDSSVCTPDGNGYYTSNPAAQNYYEWCGDHNKPLEAHPFGNVGNGGPMTLPDPNIVTNGNWYGGSPYLGGEANTRAIGPTPIPPSGTIANDPGSEAGFAFMWHSHNEREITTNNIFPGGMMMMMLVDPRAYLIDESK
ncbi:MAG: multicopper oxidase family protein [Gammaproteobacteria bacterium]|jgi:FtsP/CotA-like multicopper oxidase with cupredoxin domain|nr:multicopper oxidase family protein [Gammaproteobacteria bacterium]